MQLNRPACEPVAPPAGRVCSPAGRVSPPAGCSPACRLGQSLFFLKLFVLKTKLQHYSTSSAPAPQPQHSLTPAPNPLFNKTPVFSFTHPLLYLFFICFLFPQTSTQLTTSLQLTPISLTSKFSPLDSQLLSLFSTSLQNIKSTSLEPPGFSK